MDIVELMSLGLTLPDRLDSYCEYAQVILSAIDDTIAAYPDAEKKLLLIRMALGFLADNLSHESTNERAKENLAQTKK